MQKNGDPVIGSDEWIANTPQTEALAELQKAQKERRIAPTVALDIKRKVLKLAPSERTSAITATAEKSPAVPSTPPTPPIKQAIVQTQTLARQTVATTPVPTQPQFGRATPIKRELVTA